MHFIFNRGDFSAVLEGHGGMADSEGCKRNLFAQDVFRPMVAYLQKFERDRKTRFPIEIQSSQTCILNKNSLSSAICITWTRCSCQYRHEAHEIHDRS